MRKTNPLKTRMENLKVKDGFILVNTEAERLNAHNLAKQIRVTKPNYAIETRACIGRHGFEIHRTR